MPLTPQKRLVAALLPFSFLWVFIACVSICEREALAIHPATDLSRSAEFNAISDVHDCEGCPLSYFPKASMPERARSIIALETVSGIAPIAPSVYSALPVIFSNQVETTVHNGSPPLKLLLTLRI